MKRGALSRQRKKLKNCYSYSCLSLMMAGILFSSVYAAQDVPPPPSLDSSTEHEQGAETKPEEAVIPPVLPEENAGSDSRVLPQADVTIIHRKDGVIEEYRVNGQLRYARIKPHKGPAYYMVDTDGDGRLDKRQNDLSLPPVQQWKLHEW